MNARDPHLPLQADEAEQLGQLRRRASGTSEIVPALTDYIDVPAKSPMFDADWEQHGHIDRVVRDAAAWVEGKQVAGPEARGRAPRRPHAGDLLRGAGHQGRAAPTPCCMYGHLDKQPEFNGWRNDLGPWTPKYEDGKLYGRGGADDGYAVYAAITAILALDAQGIPRPRVVGLIESCEESGSFDLPAYLDVLRAAAGQRQPRRLPRLAAPATTTSSGSRRSLRGMVSGVLKVEILTEGIHSGDASGLVPSSFRILRQVLDRLEDSKTGRLLPESFHCEIPAERVEQARATARDPRRRGLEALPVGLRRRRRAEPADHDRPGRGAAQPHLAADAVGHRRRRLPRARQRRQRAAARTPRSSSACACRRWSTAHEAALHAEAAARGQRAVQRPRHLRTPTAAPARWAPPAGTRRRSRPGWRTR